MKRRQFLQASVAGVAMTTASQAAGDAAGEVTKVRPATRPLPILAADWVTVYESPDPATVYAYSPGIARLPNGRLVATMDQGGPDVEGPDAQNGPVKPKVSPDGRIWYGKIYTSDDRGRTWTHRADMPVRHARPFVAGDAVYVIGHQNDMGVMRSTDGGDTWSGPSWLTEGERWHQAPSNVHYTRGRVYLVMERVMFKVFPHWPVSVMAPVLMSADVNDDLSKRESWIFSNPLSFSDAIAQVGKPHLIGAPFFATGPTAPDNPGDERKMAPIGWLETNVVQFTDPDHVWYDPSGRTFHLWARAHTGSTNLAAIAKVVEAEDLSLTVSIEQAPSGEPMVYVPCPGGHLKFHILQDPETGLYWLLSSQATDSMTRPERLPRDRFSLPNNERHRLVLHFSKNCVDWCFAGRVADTGDVRQSRHYASMVIDGDDLHVLSRSGDSRAKSPHDGNLITFHTVKDFRSLVY